MILTKDNYKDTIDIVLTKPCKVSADNESKKKGIHKSIMVEVSYKGLTFEDLMAKALKSDVIAYQNGNARKNYDKLVDKSTVKVDASKPGISLVDHETKVIESFASKTPEEQKAFMRQLQTLMSAKK